MKEKMMNKESNQMIVRKLRSINNDELRTKCAKSSDDYMHDNQIDAAKEIIEAFCSFSPPENENIANNKHVVLCALMQSGKTGVCNAVVNILKHDDGYFAKYFLIQKCLFITGMNDTGLKKQTEKRIGEQIISDESNESGNEILKKIVLKQSDIGKILKGEEVSGFTRSPEQLRNTIMFIDESHYGSGANHLLTQILEACGVNWKNDKSLTDNSTYFVSVSATPHRELISDMADSKTRVVLQTGPDYFGIAEFIGWDCVFEAKDSDFIVIKDNEEPLIITYIKDALQRMNDDGIAGSIMIRVKDSKNIKRQAIIKKNQFVIDNFEIYEADASSGNSISYTNIHKNIERHWACHKLGDTSVRPLLVLIKGAYRAGVTIPKKVKDLVYMVYDHAKSPEATAQNLLGRFCGYRDKESIISEAIHNTVFYVNKQQASEYADWKEFDPITTPSGGHKMVEIPRGQIDEHNEKKVHLKSKGIKRDVLPITDEEAKELLNFKGFRQDNVRLFLEKKGLVADFIGQCYTSPPFKEGVGYIYGSGVKKKWLQHEGGASSSLYIGKSLSDFKQRTGRSCFEIQDVDKTYMQAALDVTFDVNGCVVKNNGLIVTKGKILAIKVVPNREGQFEIHKATAVVAGDSQPEKEMVRFLVEDLGLVHGKYKVDGDYNAQLTLSEEGKKYRYDFADESKKVIVEFNGDYHHCNPMLGWTPDKIKQDITAQEVWDNDARKKRLAEANGYKVLVVWEKDWKENRVQVEQTLKDEICEVNV